MTLSKPVLHEWIDHEPPLSVGDKVMLKANLGLASMGHLELKEGKILHVYNNSIDVIFDCAPGEIWGVKPSWLLRMGAPVRSIIHRERIMDMDARGTYDPKLLQPVDIAYARGVSWIKRNLREWPHGYELACEATDEELIFWFIKAED